MTPAHFVAALADTRLNAVFNPWADTCPVHDRQDAPDLRRANLERVLTAVLDTKVETMWIARDLGYRGGRRTGVALTDEVHLQTAASSFGGIELSRATNGPIVAERTAAVIYHVLERIAEPVLMWNVFPFHPHDADDPMSNRCHTRRERDATWHLLEALIRMTRPKRVIAIGRDAQIALSDLDIDVLPVRHPSYGGQTEFIASMFHHYGVTDLREVQPVSLG